MANDCPIIAPKADVPLREHPSLHSYQAMYAALQDIRVMASVTGHTENAEKTLAAIFKRIEKSSTRRRCAEGGLDVDRALSEWDCGAIQHRDMGSVQRQ